MKAFFLRKFSSGNSKEIESHMDLFKGALSGLRYFLASESPLKMMKNAFCSTSKALFILKTFNFLS